MPFSPPVTIAVLAEVITISYNPTTTISPVNEDSGNSFFKSYSMLISAPPTFHVKISTDISL